MIDAIIVDDEPAVGTIIRYFVNSGALPINIAGEARNGKEAIRLIDSVKPGLIFADIQMPIMSGFELINQRPNYNYIIITAYGSFSNAQQALRLGAKDILLKPIEYDALCNSIVRALGWKFTNNKMTNDIVEYIHAHYSENIEVNDLAKMFYSTPPSIARTFKKHMGTSIINYLHEVRMKHAMEMLASQKGSIKEVAEACGYENLNNFYKYFKDASGMTPAQYLKEKSNEKAEE